MLTSAQVTTYADHGFSESGRNGGYWMGDATGAVADFCATLRRAVRGCGVSQAELARVLNRSDSAVSALLNGQRAKPPQLDEILMIVKHCRSRAGAHPPPGLILDPTWWRARLAELQDTAEGQRRRQPRHAQEQLPIELPEAVPFDFESAVEILVGHRDGFQNVDADILGPLSLVGTGPSELPGLFKGFGARVRTCSGTARTALLCAADIVLLVSAFCDAVGRLGAVRDPEATAQIDLQAQVLEELGRVVFGSTRVRSPSDLRAEIAAAYAASADLMAFGGFSGASHDELAHLALHRYEALHATVTWDCPELRLTSETYDPDEEAEGQQATADRVGLIELGLLLMEFTEADSATTRQRELLRAPISAADGSGPAIPSLAAGYVNPAFRVAGRPADWQLSADTWWDGQPIREDIAGFLAAHFLSHQATQAPLLVLGHPGSGKSLLMKLIAARLPQSEFSCLHVELRHVPAELDVQEQLEWALFRSTGHQAPWPDALPSGTAVRVVLLDGLDELIQAGADQLDMSRQWRYLRSIEQLQQREYELGRPVVFIVTSRTVVADQVLTPPAATVLRLEPFDDARIVCWLEVWQATNRRYFATHDLEPLTWDVVRPYRELARHSLLLLMLALYDATGNPLRRLGGRDIRRVDLYERLLVEFVRRQVVKHNGPLPPAAERQAVENELRRLGVIAIGMFNRRKQSLTADEADRDLGGLLGEAGSALLFGRFFFVHEAQALVAEECLRSYEFLHATFGEYLVARLVCDELERMGVGAGLAMTTGCNNVVLRSLLSFVPLSDRAQVLNNLKELAGPAGPRWHSNLLGLLRTLFHTDDRTGDGPAGLIYHPADRRRTERDAVYEANLLVLALVVEGGLRASHFLGVADPVDRWWRCAQFWRSQFSEASWESFARSVSVETASIAAAGSHIGDGTSRTGDLRLSLRGTTELADDVSWILRSTVLGPSAYYNARGVDAADLTRRLSLLCDTDVQHVLHALAPLLRSLPNTLRTYRVDEEQRAVSGAHALMGLLCGDAGQPLAAHYADVLDVLQHLPEPERPPVAGFLVRHLVHDAARLPEETIRALLVEVIRSGVAGDGMLWGGLWPVLEEYVIRGLAQVDPDQDKAEFKALVGHLRRYSALFQGPQERLQQLLREAGSTRIWAEGEWESGSAALEWGRALFEALPADKRDPGLAIGLLRLAHELGQREWLDTNAEPLLLTLRPTDVLRMRASDADILRPLVRDVRLLGSFETIQEIWRGPAAGGRAALD
ncbi:ATP-binding protein [Streptomyces katrae]|uniref:NACHT N-terminal helical domain 7-containing protein n=1 Tax=Streptomyces katrae TaxID=68223 RepID=UPI000696BBAC|nr:ATP-binding protein [Streptomyces katrae]